MEDFITLRSAWSNAINDILDSKLDDLTLDVLTHQSIDSVKRISIYSRYRQRAIIAEMKGLNYWHSKNPFTLAQRQSLSIETRIWCIYLATYFGKSLKSKWDLFDKATFYNQEIIKFEEILYDRKRYFNYLLNKNFFNGEKFSNHRKFIKKSLTGHRGVLKSMDYFISEMPNFTFSTQKDFDYVYRLSQKIPNFGRLGAFDFTASMCKCHLNVEEPKSMYHHNSTGPLKALQLLLDLSGVEAGNNKQLQIDFGDELLQWFFTRSLFPMTSQVLEDAICNWQKSPYQYVKYSG